MNIYSQITEQEVQPLSLKTAEKKPENTTTKINKIKQHWQRAWRPGKRKENGEREIIFNTTRL